MADDFGSGVSRTLSAIQRAFQAVVWQKGKPPLDSEFNLMAQIQNEQLSSYISASMHSGWLTDPTAATQDFTTDPSWSNFFKLGRQRSGEEAPILWANVNGWMVPVTGTGVVDGDTSNRVNLNPPPDSDSRIDLVFLEVWKGQVAPNPSEVNKPTSATVWKYGNVEFGGTNITDDIEDPAIGFETSERVQVQYRLRVVGSGTGLGSSVALDEYPDGLDDPNVVGQGAASDPQAGFQFTNMREELGDPGLWRAGNGTASNALGTVDGYTYAIPIAGIFRRNSQVFRAVEAAGNANQNGAFDRNPTAATLTDPRTGAKALLTATLTNAISATAVGNIQIENLIGSGLDDTNINFSSLFVVINGETIKINSVDTGASPGTMNVPATAGRGRNATQAEVHAAGSEVVFYNARPDALFADEITVTDIHDLRRSVQTGDWDYQRMLSHNLSALIQGRLRSSWKQAGIGDTQGPYVVEVSSLLSTGLAPNQTEVLDGPDGIRQIFSDAATIQGDVTVLLAEDATQAGGIVTPGGFDTPTTWEIGAGFQPGGFLNNGGGTTWDNGSIIELYIGGSSGGDGARGTFRDGNERAVRFVSPREFWLSDTDQSAGLQHPISLRFLNEPSMHAPTSGATATEHPGPMYPQRSTNFEKPFCVLGGLVNSELNVTVPEVYNAPQEVRLPGLDFDVAGDWFVKDANGKFVNDPTAITKPVLRSARTLWDMLTAGGSDLSGASSELYVVLQGDTVAAGNNGLYQIVGAGSTAGYTTQGATAADRVRVRAIRPAGAAVTFPSSPGSLTAAQVRSQYTNAEDGNGGASLISSAMIVLTDVAGTTGGASNPWNSANLGANPLVNGSITGRLAVNTTLQYHPGRSGMARRPDEVWRFAVVNPTGSTYLRQSPTAQDSTFASQSGTASNETYYDINHIQTWNRLSSRGLHAPDAPAYGGEVVAFSEQDREAEAFFDAGSKTVMFRPMRNVLMTLKSIDTGSALFPSSYPPSHGGGFPIDGAGLYPAGREVGFPLPPETMPRFGRYDIPFNVDLDTSAAQPHFHQGINHLFVDDANNDSADQFHIVGGEDNGGGAGGVLPMLFQTGSSSGLLYGARATVAPTSRPAYQGRLYEDLTVQSSDVGRGLKGIQLPPFMGIARIYGVYDRRDFLPSGVTFQTDRLTPDAGAAPNLLRTDVTKQTMFIVQGGAEDITGDADDHTYVVPQDLIDIRRSDSYINGESFEDLEYIVECAIFGFARGFINRNNFVLLRRHSGDGTEFFDTSDVLLEDARMVVPTAAVAGEQVSIGYSRTPYQGDPYMTRAGDARTVSDYEARYGQVAQSDAFELATAIQQFDSDGNLIVETPNRRALQVLASVDFWTTLGTGKIGGMLFPGTVTDVGFTQDTPDAASRVPDSDTQARWRVDSRAFTEGQGTNPTRANLDLAMVGAASGGETVTITKGGVDTVFTAVLAAPTPPLEFLIGASPADTVGNLRDALNATVSPVRTDLLAVNDVGSSRLTIEARAPGEEGRGISVTVGDSSVFALRLGNDLGATSSPLRGGDNLILNAGLGSSQLDLTGMTDRLPLGILLQDADFMCEDPLRNGFSSFHSTLGAIQPVQTTLPLTTGGEEFTRLVGGPGQWLGQADGGILRYAAYSDAVPTGSKRFRLYRGSSGFVMTEPNPGGPLDWVSGALPAELLPVLKGGVLAGKALLVRNFVEDAFSTPSRVSHGSEIQMVILTRGILGKGNAQEAGVTVGGILSPTGYGEGYAAADRYRLEGKPLSTGPRDTVTDVNDVDLATFPFDISVEVDC
jgi:hypothetical protein